MIGENLCITCKYFKKMDIPKEKNKEGFSFGRCGHKYRIVMSGTLGLNGNHFGCTQHSK